MIVGNKANGQISKRVLRENKTRQIFQKTNVSYPDSPFCLITDDITLKTNHYRSDSVKIIQLNEKTNISKRKYDMVFSHL